MIDFSKSDLLLNLDKLHTTQLGVERIKRNLSLNDIDVVHMCRDLIHNPHSLISRKGKNWYVRTDNCEITINTHSFTIITAHKIKG